MAFQHVEYLMDDPREGQRLAEKVDAQGWVEKYLAPQLQPHQRILDVGCGPGVIAAAAALHAPETQVTALDLSEERLAAARQRFSHLPNLSARRGDALRLPFEAAQFDLVYSRFLLEYVPDKDRAVLELARVCAPGGKVLLQDLDGQLVWHYPEDQELQARLERVLHGLAATGFDPFVGRKLYALCQRAGLTGLIVQVEPYHLYAGRIDERNYRLWAMKLEIVLPLASKILGSQAEAERLKADFLAYLEREDTLTYSIVFTVTGTKPYPQTEQ